jgi:hypothetical protein
MQPMSTATWSRLGEADCIRVSGIPANAQVHVRPQGTGASGALPPMAGQLRPDAGDVCFVPRFPFLAGTVYAVRVDGADVAVLTRPGPGHPATAEVLGITPAAAEVPRNLLRCYIQFSEPMSDGQAARHVRLVRDDGCTLAGALLPGPDELWDAGRRRLTVLLDPARIKRGLAGHRAEGYPLRAGEPFRLVVDQRFADARGIPLRAGAERRYLVGGDERRLVRPEDWALSVPRVGTAGPMRAGFGRPLDHALLARCLRVAGPDGQPVNGVVERGAGDQSWQLVPRQAWAPGPHQLIVDPVLEDVAGNSVRRVFDRDLAHPGDDPRDIQQVILPFHPR